MPYYVGIDLGTTYTAAAVWRDGRVEIATLGTRAAVVPSVVLFRDDGTVLVGEAAERRALTEPQRVAREFKRRFGDSTPIIVGGTPYSADALSARLLRWVLDTVSEREGSPPAAVVVSHPANWGPFKKELLQQTFRLADLHDVTTLTEPEAAAIHYASQEKIEPGETIAIYDLGGGTFDAALLRHTADGWEIIGEPEGIERLGGIDFDQAVFHHVEESLGASVFEALDQDEPSAMAAVARLRQECVEAKEALSSDVDATIPVLLPNVQTDVRLTRSELEDMIRPALADSIAALRRALRSAGIEAEEVQSVLLVGGSSRLPLVAQLVSSELRRPVAVDAHPKHAVALGAAIVAAERGTGRSVDTEVVPSIEIMEPGATSFTSRSVPASLSGPATVPVVPVVPLPTPPEGSRHEPTRPQPQSRQQQQQQVNVPAPPVRPKPRPDPPAPPRRPPPMLTPQRQTVQARPPKRRRRSNKAGFMLVLVVALAAAAAGTFLLFDQLDNGDNGNGNNGGGGTETTLGEPREPVDVAVPGTVDWTDTGIDVQEGDRVLISATGVVFHNDVMSTGPDGDSSLRNVDGPIGRENHSGLIGRITEDGEPFLVGEELDRPAEATGRLFLGINDSGVDNNSGEFEAVVTVTPG